MSVIRVMLVDDHAATRDGLRAFLANDPNMQIVGEAENGHQAIKRVVDLLPDIVIMDIGMPELNGIEATHQLRKIDPKLKVIALTRHADVQSVKAMFDAGAKGYVLKTASLKDVRSAILTVKQGQTFFTPPITKLLSECDTIPQQASEESGAPSPQILTSKERQILQLLAEGLANKQIATVLSMSVKTVETHRGHLMNKLGLHNVANLTRYAIRHGLTEL